MLDNIARIWAGTFTPMSLWGKELQDQGEMIKNSRGVVDQILQGLNHVRESYQTTHEHQLEANHFYGRTIQSQKQRFKELIPRLTENASNEFTAQLTSTAIDMAWSDWLEQMDDMYRHLIITPGSHGDPEVLRFAEIEKSFRAFLNNLQKSEIFVPEYVSQAAIALQPKPQFIGIPVYVEPEPSPAQTQQTQTAA
jgi:preprotein translocase subunit SecA